MPRPRRHLPAGAREYVLSCAADCALQETKIARGLGMGFATWRRLLRDNPDAQELWTEAKAIERDNVLQKLFERSMEGDTSAAKFLLAARHGMSEKAEAGADTGRNAVTINLPASLDANTYKRMVSVEQAESNAVAPEAVGRHDA